MLPISIEMNLIHTMCFSVERRYACFHMYRLVHPPGDSPPFIIVQLSTSTMQITTTNGI